MKKWMIGIGAVALVLAGAAAMWARRAPAADYAPSPFAPLATGGFVPWMERAEPQPPSEKKAYWVESRALRARLSSGGAMQKAGPKACAAAAAIDKKQYVAARELAQEILAADPESVAGRLLFAEVQYRGEQNLPVALREARRARRAVEAGPADEDGREWYLRVLSLEESILGYMNRREEQLTAISRMEEAGRPVPWRRVFALIKMARLDEAEAVIADLEKSGRWEMTVLNTRSMLAEARHDRAGMYAAGKAMTTRITDSPVLWNNFALACEGDLRLEEAERAFVRSATGRDQDFNASAYTKLAMVYARQGRAQEAWHALKQAQAQRLHRPPHTLEQDQGSLSLAAAAVMAAHGRGEMAYTFAKLANDAPNRSGSSTVTEREELFAGTLALWAALTCRVAEANEEAALNGGVLPAAGLRAEAWAAERRLLKILSDETFLIGLARPYLVNDGHVGPWLNSEIIRLLPAGVAAHTLRRAREEETHEGAAAYFDALEADLSLRRGYHEMALSKAEAALAKLPPAERLLRGRTAAVASEAARLLGRGEDSLRLAGHAMRDYPQAFRWLGLALPVRIEDDGSEGGRLLAAALRKSPRFRVAEGAFVLRASAEGDKLSARLSHPGGELHVQADVPAKEGVEAAYRRLHERMASPAIDVTAAEGHGLTFAR